MEYYFPAMLSKGVKIGTWMVLLYFILLPLFIKFIAWRKIPPLALDPINRWINVNFGVIYLIFLFVIITIATFDYLNAPKGYSVNKDSVIIYTHKRAKIVIPISEVESVWRDIQGISKKFNKKKTKSFGIFGVTGTFYSKSIGWYNMYITDGRKLVVLELKKKIKYVISPDNPDRFISILKQRLTNTQKNNL